MCCGSDMDKERKKPEEYTEQDSKEYQFLNQVIKKKPMDWKSVVVRAAGVAAAAVLFGVAAAGAFTLTLWYTAGYSGFDPEEHRVSIQAEEEQGAAEETEDASKAQTVSTGTAEADEVPPSEEEGHVENAHADLQAPPAVEPDAAAEPDPAAEQDAAAAVSSVTDTELPSAESTAGESAAVRPADVFAEPGLPEARAEEGTHGADELPMAAAGGDVREETGAEEQVFTLEAYRGLFQDMLAVAEQPEHAIVQVTGITSEMDYFNQNYENRRQISGLAIARSDDSLFVLTEYRVVENVERILVTFYDGSMADAVFQKSDLGTGMTVLKVPLERLQESTLENLQMAPLGNSRTVERGEPVLALGSPLGYSDSVAYGVVTSVTNTVSCIDAQYMVLTTDIKGSTEGSGVLVNLDGRVIGIIAQQYTGDNGTVTALAVSGIKPLLEKLSNNEAIPLIGLTGQNVTQELADRTGIPRGLLVTAVEPDSPAMLAGIKEYDVLIRMNDRPVSTIEEYQRFISRLEDQEGIKVEAMRKGAEGYREITFDVTAGTQ